MGVNTLCELWTCVHIYFLRSPKLEILQVFIFTNTEFLCVVIQVNL